ncbi:hypothetical protein [Actinomadura rubrisoli]|uniref:Uncharacterized protein n=1 Tax=Actinomadura rubrisoli TaxID=2530368 RepID=A0A4R5CIL1_9ACTN|nr:hypothetical protein [Actinomadura rubrisoli]TDD97202.1 hypothetical protein E1298_01835 [Actinomadura rubrisoli]
MDMIDLYHHTTESSADKIVAERKFRAAQEYKGQVWFSNVRHGFYGREYGPIAVHVRMPVRLVKEEASYVEREEVFYVVQAGDILPEHIIGVA